MVREFVGVLLALGLGGIASCGESTSKAGAQSAGPSPTRPSLPSNAPATSAQSSGGGSALPEAGAPDAASRNDACQPTCGAICGVDDGCGIPCGCPNGRTCVDQICVDPTCGPCRPNERCNAGGQCKCVPDCENRACLPDGCGATCECPPNLVLNPSGRAVPRPECTDTCESSGAKCGDVCGTSCGSCAANQVCNLGKCECAPHCDGASCSDGCGGTCACPDGTVCNQQKACVAAEACHDTCATLSATCGTVCGVSCGACDTSQACIDGLCREGLNCTDCNLQLKLLDRTVLSGKIVRVTLGVELAAQDSVPAPRLMDLWIAADHTVELVDAQAGPALLETGKCLFKDEVTKESWQRRPDKSYQLLAYTVAGSKRVKPGRMMNLTFDLAEPGPVRFALQRHAQTFAPLDSDSALQATRYDQAVVVSQ